MLFWLEMVGFTCQNEDQRKSEDALVDQNLMKTHSFLVHHHHHLHLLQRRDEALKGDRSSGASVEAVLKEIGGLRKVVSFCTFEGWGKNIFLNSVLDIVREECMKTS